MATRSPRAHKFKFTVKAIEALPPQDRESPSTNAEYSDEECVGLRMTVSKTGRKFFDFRYRFRGKKRVIRIGEFPALSPADARGRANELKNMISRTIDPHAERVQRRNVPTFAEFATQEYMPWAKQHKKSWKGDQSKLDADLLPAFGRMKISDITSRDIQQFLTKISARASPATANRFFALISKILSLGVEWQIIEKNPCRGIKKFKESTGRERFLSKEEIKRFLSALDEYGGNVSAQAIKFLLFTGLRLSEALETRWDDVDMEKGTLLIHMDRAKSGKSRHVVLNRLAQEVLRTMLEQRATDGIFVFPGKKIGQHLSGPKRVFEAVRNKAKITEFRIHDVRHTYASTAAGSAGVNLFLLQKLLGHGSSQMTQRYAHLTGESLRKATENVADAICEATSA